MAYISKQSLLQAYKVLSGNTSTPTSQGATQAVSAIRYLFALDRFIKNSSHSCDTKSIIDKDSFVEYVGEIVSVNGSLYTCNFHTDLKEEADYKVGSNFFSVNVVKESIVNPAIKFDFPRRSKNGQLFNVKDGVLSVDKTLFINAKKYMPSEYCRIAFALWLCRNFNFTSAINYHNIISTLEGYYSFELISTFFPSTEKFSEYVSKYGVIEEQTFRSTIEKSEILSIFQEEVSKNMLTNINKYRPYITAIKSKPFLLLAGISGTGKSRIVRELARACWDEGSAEYLEHKPRNFEMVQVKPNWHDSSELLGYVSRIGADKDGNGVTFVAGDFLKFIARAWEEQDVPYFLCLDEMNLAPVEQYFAEYLSVVESRKATKDGVVTDPILKKSVEPWYFNLCAQLTSDEELHKQFLNDGISIPQNLIVIGTVNMDETTFSFSRKVLDRAMTIEMNNVDLEGGLTDRYEAIGKLGTNELIGTCVEGVDVYSSHKAVCDKVIAYLKAVNDKLEGTPFKIAYRTRNEFLLYVVNNLPYNKDEDGENLDQNYVIARALDEITNMKILSRIEGDETKVSEKFLKGLADAIKEQLEAVCVDLFDAEESKNDYKSISLAKLDEMSKKLVSGYTSFWS